MAVATMVAFTWPSIVGVVPATAAQPDPAPLEDGFLQQRTQVRASYRPLVGDFDCDGLAREIVWYAPGPASDHLWEWSPGTRGLEVTSTPLSINGDYEPLVVPWDDAGGCGDDILWYAPGHAADHVWDAITPVDGAGGSVRFRSERVHVNGVYTPVATEIGGQPGVFWYAPGRATDYVWQLGDGRIDSAKGPQVVGDYRPVRATNRNGAVGILWYAPGTAADHFWAQMPAHTAPPGTDVGVSINGHYQPQAVGSDVLLYGPGSAPDFLLVDIDAATGALATRPGRITGDYRVASSARPRGPVVWHAPGSAPDHIWWSRPSKVTVTSSADASDADPGDRFCETTPGAGDCTLRAAIDVANADPIVDSVAVEPGLGTITLGIPGAGEDANATGDLDVTDDLVIDGNGATVDAGGDTGLGDRVMEVRDGVTLAISDTTVTGGHVAGVDMAAGGGLRGATDSELDLANVTLTDNHAEWGGGGLAIYRGAATVTGSTITANSGDGFGGGGIQSVAGLLTILDTTISDNTTLGDGGGLTIGDGGTLLLRGSTVAANDAAGEGGGIWQLRGTLTLETSTLSSNDAYLLDETNTSAGSALHLIGSVSASILATTVRADTTEGAIHLHLNDLGTLALGANAVTNSVGAACDTGGVTLVSDGYNWTSDTSCGLGDPTDTVGTDPLLGPLEDNGGPTRTHLPQPGSPLLHAIPIGTAGLCDGTLPTDQRGVARPQGTACDIGAVEVVSP